MFRQLNSLRLLLTFSAATTLFACNNESTSKETKTDSSTAAQPAKTDTVKPPAGPTVPFNAMVIKHAVADYAKWKPLFDADSAARTAAGIHTIDVARGIENPNGSPPACSARLR